MTILNRTKFKCKPEIDLSGPDGNAFALLAVAKKLSGDLGKDYNNIKTRMTEGDYENLIQVFDTEFGGVVDLLR